MVMPILFMLLSDCFKCLGCPKFKEFYGTKDLERFLLFFSFLVHCIAKNVFYRKTL